MGKAKSADFAYCYGITHIMNATHSLLYNNKHSYKLFFAVNLSARRTSEIIPDLQSIIAEKNTILRAHLVQYLSGQYRHIGLIVPGQRHWCRIWLHSVRYPPPQAVHMLFWQSALKYLYKIIWNFRSSWAPGIREMQNPVNRQRLIRWKSNGHAPGFSRQFFASVGMPGIRFLKRFHAVHGSDRHVFRPGLQT